MTTLPTSDTVPPFRRVTVIVPATVKAPSSPPVPPTRRQVTVIAGGDLENASVSSPTKRRLVHTNKDTTTRVPVESLSAFLRFVAKKTVTYRGFPIHLFFIICFTLSALHPRTSHMSQTSLGIKAKYFVEDPAVVVTTPAKFYQWLPSVVTELWTPAPESQSSPILFLVLRQYRRGAAACVGTPPPSLAADPASKKCYSLEWSGDPMEPFHPRSFPGADRAGHNSVYPQSSPQFTEVFSYNNESVSEVLGRMEVLRLKEWIRAGIGAIIIDAVFINKVDHHYAHVETLLEIHHSGLHTPQFSTYVFVPPDMNTIGGRGMLVNEILLTISICFLVHELVVSVRFNMCLDDRKLIGSVEGFDVFNAALIILMISLQYYRYVVWNLVTTRGTTGGNDEDAFKFIMDYVKASHDADFLVPWCIILSYLRTFLYLQYNERLGVINETIFSSVNDLIGVGIVFVFILLSFSVTAYYLWGVNIRSFESVGHALSTMLRIMLSGALGDFQKVIDLDPTPAHLFFLCFIVVSWLVLLNITVSVLATSFGAVFETKSLQKRPRWNPAVIVVDIALFIRRLREPNTAEIPEGLLPRGAIYINSKFVMENLLAMDVLRRSGRRPEERITLEELQTMTSDFIDPDRTAAIFRKAFLMIGNQNARIRQQKLAKKGYESRKNVTDHVLKQSALIAEAHRRIAPPSVVMRLAHDGDEIGLDDLKEQAANVSAAMQGLAVDMKAQNTALVMLRRNLEEFK